MAAAPVAPVLYIDLAVRGNIVVQRTHCPPVMRPDVGMCSLRTAVIKYIGATNTGARHKIVAAFRGMTIRKQVHLPGVAERIAPSAGDLRFGVETVAAE